MTEKTPDRPVAKPARTRDERLKEALKANLQRRKAQARARQGNTKKKEAD